MIVFAKKYERSIFSKFNSFYEFPVNISEIYKILL